MTRCFVIATLIGAGVTAPASHAYAQAAPFPRASGVITVRGVAHPYLTEGRGEPCIVTGLAMNYPPLFSARLKQEIRFLFVNFRRSWDAPDDRTADANTLDSLVQEVDDVRRGFGLDRACLVGHSSTGLVALEYAARYPERVSRLILIGVHPFWNQELFDAWTAFWAADASPERKAALADNIRRMPDSLLGTMSERDSTAFRYSRTGPRLFFDPTYDIYWAWAGRSFSAAMLRHYWKAVVADYNPWDRLAGNTVPAFIALGRQDHAVPYRLWDRFKGRSELTFSMFQRSAHFPMIEEPVAFDRALLRWQRRYASAP